MVQIVLDAFNLMKGSEIFVKKIPSVKITDLAKAIAPNCVHEEIGMRPGEKLHEQLISEDEAAHTYEFRDYYKILSPLNGWSNASNRIRNGTKISEGFSYSSDNNNEWLQGEKLKKWLMKVER